MLRQKKQLIFIAIFLLFLGSLSAYVIFRRQESSFPSQVVRMNAEGFFPESVRIKKGQSVTWLNEGGQPHWPASDLHPTHGIYPEFDPQEPITPGESWTFTFTKLGVWRYHDHLRPILRGIIEVRK